MMNQFKTMICHNFEVKPFEYLIMVGSMGCTNSFFHRERELLMIYTKPVYTLLNNLEVKVQGNTIFFPLSNYYVSLNDRA